MLVFYTIAFKCLYFSIYYFITARKRSLRRLCFYTCLSFCPQGGHAWLLWGGLHGCWGACVVALGGMHGCLGGMRGCSGACVVAPGGHVWFLLGGMHGFFRGACMVFSRGGMHRIRWDMVNEWAVHILLECILVKEVQVRNA